MTNRLTGVQLAIGNAGLRTQARHRSRALPFFAWLLVMAPFACGGSGADGSSGVVAKFCNTLQKGGQNVTLSLALGQGGSLVNFSASSGTCQPALAQECVSIPGGAVPYVLTDPSAGTTLDSGNFTDLVAGGHFFMAELDSTGSYPVLNGYQISAGDMCSTFNPLTDGSGNSCAGNCSCTCSDGSFLTGLIGGACTCTEACTQAGAGSSGTGTCS